MIISDSKKFIFIHIPKTAGTSIAAALRQYQNPKCNALHSNSFDRKHPTTNEIKTHLGEERFNQYYKFAFVRNPWDRVLSNYYWHIKQGELRHGTFEDYIQNLPQRDIPRFCQLDWLRNENGHIWKLYLYKTTIISEIISNIVI